MTRGQVLDPITAPQSIFLSPSPTRSAPFAAFCPHPRPVTACVVPIPTPLPYFLSPSPPRYCRVVQTRTPHSHAWRTRWIYFDTFVRMFWDFIRIYVNSFYFLHFVRNVIVLLIFNIALLHNNKYTSEYHIHLTTARCSLITKVHRHCQIPSTAGRALGMRTWRELGLVASLICAAVGGIIIQYNGPGHSRWSRWFSDWPQVDRVTCC